LADVLNQAETKKSEILPYVEGLLAGSVHPSSLGLHEHGVSGELGLIQ
jgi:hypothetical protein